MNNSLNDFQYKIIFDNNPNPVLVVDKLLYNVLEANNAVSELFEVKKEKLLKSNLLSLFHTNEVETLKLKDSGLQISGSASKFIKYKKNNGTLIDLEILSKDIIYNETNCLLININYTALNKLGYDFQEQKKIEKRLKSQLEVTRVLAESVTQADAIPKILKAICDGLDFQIGELWLANYESDLLQMEGSWHKPEIHADEFVEVSKKCKFGKGVSLQGKVWENSKPIWNSHALEDQFFPRAAHAAKLKLHTALAFPIYCREKVMGVMAFYKSETEEPDNELLIMLDTLGKQIGDFIERKLTEPALQESEGLYRNLVEISPDAITYTDLSGKILFCNQQAAQLFGFNKVEEIVGQNLYAFIAPENQSSAIENEHKTIEGGFTKNIEYVLLKKDGERFFVEENTSIVQDSFGNPKAFIGVIRDITKRRHDEEEIKTKILQQEAIAELGQHALAGSNIALLMEETASIVTTILNVEYCEIMEYEKDNNSFLLKSGKGWNLNNNESYHISSGSNSHAGYTMLANIPVIVKNYHDEKRFNPSELLKKHNINSGITVVIHGKKEPFGVLGAHSAGHKIFTQNDSHFLQAIANVLAAAIARKNVEEELANSLNVTQQAKAQSEESKKRLAFLAEASRILNSSLDYNKTLVKVANLLVMEFSDLCVIDLLENNKLKRIVISGNNKTLTESLTDYENRFPLSMDKTNTILGIINSGKSKLFQSENEPFIFNLNSDKAYLKEIKNISFKSGMIVPIKIREEVLGIISIISLHSTNIYSNLELSLAEDLARRAAFAIENARLYKEASMLNEKLDQRVKARNEELEISNRELEIEVKLRNKAVDELSRRAQKQSAIAFLSQIALIRNNLNTLFNEAVKIISSTLSIEYCDILKYLCKEKLFILEAGIGWNEKFVVGKKIELAQNTHEIYTLCSKEPVLIHNIKEENRFIISEILAEHGVISGVSLLIRNIDNPFGIIGVYTKSKREFSPDDINFLNTIANVLSAAIERNKIEDELKSHV